MCVTKKRLYAVIQLTDILSLFVQKAFVAHNYIYIFKDTFWLKMTCPSHTINLIKNVYFRILKAQQLIILKIKMG